MGKYKIFSQKARDQPAGYFRNRNEDTELKFIFNFLEEHWDSGNYFEINATSLYNTCQSCQGYLAYLAALAEKHNKKIVFKVTSPTNIKGSTDAKLKRQAL